MGIKVAVVGGGSTYTPELVDGLRPPTRPAAGRRARPPRHRRRAARGRRRARPADARRPGLDRPADPAPTDRDAAIDGADFVLIQLRVGGQAARLVDETLPPRFGLIGQETTGAGGFAKALRTVPVVLDLAELVGRRAAPGRMDRRLHQPGRDRDPGAARRRAIARSACATSRSPCSGGWPRSFGVEPERVAARARRAQPPELGARRPGRWRRPAARAARAEDATSWPAELRLPAELIALGRRRSPPTTCATTT